MATVSPRSTPTEGGLPVTHQSSSSCTLVPHDSIKRHSNDRGGPYLPSPCYGISTKPPGLPTNDILASIPPGCGRAELLPGRTIRLIVRPVRSISAAAGQYALLTIPVLSRFTSHPFTIAATHLLDPHTILATAKDIESGVTITSQESSPACNQAIEFIIRARQGLTLDLWNHLNAVQTYDKRIGRYNPLILDVRVDGPYGSSARINWKSYGSVLVIVGGSGVAFGLSIVQSLCHAIAEAHTESGVRNLRTNRTDHRGLWSTARLGEFHLKNNRQNSLNTTRIRFVWVVREYSHLMWCASRLRQFAQMVPPDTLDIDIFVTNFSPAITYRPVSAIGDGHSCFIIGDPNQSLTRPKSSSNRSQSAQSQITASDGLERGQNDSSPNLSDPDEKGHQSSIKKHHSDDSTSYRWLGTTPDEDGVDDSYIFMLLTTFDGEEDDSDLESVKLSNAIKNEGLLVQQMASPNIELTHSGHSPPASPQIASDFAAHVHPMLSSVSMSIQPRTVIEPHPYHSRDLHIAILNDDDDMKADETLVADIASPPHSPLDVACGQSAIAGLTPGALSPCSKAQMSQPLPSRPASPMLPPKAPSLLGGRLTTHIHMPGMSPSCVLPQCITPGVLPLPLAKHGFFDDLSSRGSLSSTSGSGRSFHHGRRLSTIYSVPDSPHSQIAHAPSSHANGYDASKSVHSLSPAIGAGPSEKRSLYYLFNLPLRERDDMAYIAALARPGHPPLDKILSSEVETSTGGLMVACCGPSSLDKMVRELVSNQIDPSRVKKGDERGFITFYSEEFSS
ncbi:hypothetical protein DL93DRAFT_2084986 [Clavulina sp. PMI_390]|nr:hypothetical protein DL93DRAFT_2084986 [Clavulina sp. PMI_390]